MTEFQILNSLQQMTMAFNAYKTQTGTSDRSVAELIIAGFSGQLKGWWDYHLTVQQQTEILFAIQKDEDSLPILDQLGNTIQDSVSTLILTIALHFIGDSSHLKDKNVDLLSNLRCKKLSDFQWYKSTFLTRVMLREDSNQPFWKEKFLAGLPTLLGERVRNTLRQASGSHIISYDHLTYGELISTTQKEGLKICQDLKLQKHLKWELKKSKKELGTFCKQFDYSYSKDKTCKGDCSKKSSPKTFSKPRKFHKNFTSEEPFYRNPHRKTFRSKDKASTSRHKKTNLKDVTCNKCGKKGHIFRYCKVSKKNSGT